MFLVWRDLISISHRKVQHCSYYNILIIASYPPISYTILPRSLAAVANKITIPNNKNSIPFLLLNIQPFSTPWKLPRQLLNQTSHLGFLRHKRAVRRIHRLHQPLDPRPRNIFILVLEGHGIVLNSANICAVAVVCLFPPSYCRGSGHGCDIMGVPDAAIAYWKRPSMGPGA